MTRYWNSFSTFPQTFCVHWSQMLTHQGKTLPFLAIPLGLTWEWLCLFSRSEASGSWTWSCLCQQYTSTQEFILSPYTQHLTCLLAKSSRITSSMKRSGKNVVSQILEKLHEMLSSAHNSRGHLRWLKPITRGSMEEGKDPNLYSNWVTAESWQLREERKSLSLQWTHRSSHSPEDVRTHVCAQGHWWIPTAQRMSLHTCVHKQH